MLYYNDSIISVNLEKEFNLDGDVVGYFFLLPMLCFAVFSPIVSKLSQKIERRACISIGLFIGFIGCFCTGPSQVFNFPK